MIRVLMSPVFAFAIVCGCQNDDPRPCIALDRNEVHLGVVAPESPVSATFELSNQGNADLILWDLTSSCGCTNAAIDKRVILPGESASIVVEMKSPSAMGPFVQRVTFASNDPMSPHNQLTVDGTAMWDITPSKSRLLIRTESGASSKAAESFDILSPTGSPFEVKGIACSQSWLSVRKVSATDFAECYEVTCTPTQSGRFVENIVISTSSQIRPLITVPVDVVVGERQRLSPNRIFLSKQYSDDTVHQIQIRHNWGASAGWPANRAFFSESPWKVLDFGVVDCSGDECVYKVTVQCPDHNGVAKANLCFESDANTTEEMVVTCVTRREG